MSTSPTRPLPSAVRDKLGKLLPMLSSDHDGERDGAVAAIERTLRSNGCDWHDLAASIATPAPVREPPRTARAHKPWPDFEAMDSGDLIRIIDVLCGSSAMLNARSRDFLDSLSERAGRFTVVYLSPKQKQWLEDLVLKAKGAAS